jgi:hypothetical protein
MSNASLKISMCVTTALLALACNRENDRVMTPANGSSTDSSNYGSGTPSTTGESEPNYGSGTTGSGTTGSGSSMPGSGSSTPGSGSGTTGSGSGIPGSGSGSR